MTTWFQALFTPILWDLFSFRSPYYFTIGLKTYLELGIDFPKFTRDNQRTLLRNFVKHDILTPTGLSPSTVDCSKSLWLRYQHF